LKLKFSIHRRLTERGSAMVEFALTIPIFAALLMGIFTFGPIIHDAQVLPEAVRAGARAASLQSLERYEVKIGPDTELRYYECGTPLASMNPDVRETIAGAARLATWEYLQGTHLAEIIPANAIKAKIDFVPDSGVGTLSNKKMIEVAITWENVADSCTICFQQYISGLVLEERHTFILEGNCEF